MDWRDLAALIELAGALIIAGHAVAAMASLAHRRDPDMARRITASGALWGLNFKMAATLLKTLTLTNWSQIGMFAAIFALRLILKQGFSHALAKPLTAAHSPSSAATASSLPDGSWK